MCSANVPLDLAVRQTCDEESGLRQLIDVLRKQTPFKEIGNLSLQVARLA